MLIGHKFSGLMLKQSESYQNHHHLESRPAPHNQHIQMQIVIIGGGIGGLACAIGLRNGGHEVTVLEKVPVMAEACSIIPQN